MKGPKTWLVRIRNQKEALEEAEVYNGDDVKLVDEGDIDVDDAETDTCDEDDSTEVA